MSKNSHVTTVLNGTVEEVASGILALAKPTVPELSVASYENSSINYPARSGRTRIVDYTDAKGRKFFSTIPEEASDGEAIYGVKAGPPDLSALGLPADLEVVLHNHLLERGVLTYNDARHRRSDIVWALQATLGIEVLKIAEAYYNAEGLNNAS